MTEIDDEVLGELVKKANQIRRLEVKYMNSATAKVKRSLASMVTKIIQLSPQSLEWLDLANAKFEESAGS